MFLLHVSGQRRSLEQRSMNLLLRVRRGTGSVCLSTDGDVSDGTKVTGGETDTEEMGMEKHEREPYRIRWRNTGSRGKWSCCPTSSGKRVCAPRFKNTTPGASQDFAVSLSRRPSVQFISCYAANFI